MSRRAHGKPGKEYTCSAHTFRNLSHMLSLSLSYALSLSLELTRALSLHKIRKLDYNNNNTLYTCLHSKHTLSLSLSPTDTQKTQLHTDRRCSVQRVHHRVPQRTDD
jgi:hypothetical protein